MLALMLLLSLPLSINWADVQTKETLPASLPAIPEGCSCAATATTPCTLFKCDCVCDLTANACDVDCCCDPDCDEAARSMFSTCLPDGSVDSTSTTCIDPNDITVNLKRRMAVAPNSDPLDSMLCVVVDNNPSKGNFFITPDEQTSAVFGSDAVPASQSFSQSSFATTEVIKSFYDAHKQIGAALPLNADSLQADGVFTLSRRALSGSCQESSVTFLDSLPSESCTVLLPSVSACEALSLAAVMEQRLATAPSSRPTSPSAYRTPTLVSVVKRSASGAETAFADGDSTAVAVDGDACTCSNVLVDVRYDLIYDGDSKLSAVEVRAVLADVTLPQDNGTCTVASLPQSTAVVFRSADDAAESVAERSGNPGYLLGKKLLVGRYVTLGSDATLKQAVDIPAGGLPLLSTDGSGQCTTEPGDPILYGVETVSSCATLLTAAELEAACTSDVPTVFNISSPLVGIYGNSAFNLFYEWQPITVEAVQAETVYNPALRQCNDKVTTLNYEFLSADVGQLGSPQRKIIAARAFYSTGAWQHTASDPTEAQPFQYRVVVHWLTLPDGALEEYIPPLPPFLPTLPNDVFFPFTITSPASTARPVASLLVAALLAALALLV